MEIENTIFKDLESFGKGRFFKMAIMESFLLFGEILKYSKYTPYLSVYIRHRISKFVHFTTYNMKDKPPKDLKCAIKQGSY